MSFLSPAFLWTLLALAPLAAIYFLKVRPRKRTTTAFFLWEKIFTEKKANSLLHKLRDLFSLLLMLLAFALIAFALSRPTMDEDARLDLLLIVDTSASMETAAGAGTRFEEAREHLRNIVRGLNGNQRAAIVEVGESVEFVSNFTESPRELLDAIDTIEPWAGALNTNGLAEFFSGKSDWSDEVRVVFLTDGQFETAGDFVNDEIEVLLVGESSPNLGLTVADLVRLPENRLGLYYKVVSSFPNPVEVDLLLKFESGGGQVRKLIPLSINPGENDAEFFEVEDGEAGRWIAELDIDDALVSDNRAFLTVNEPAPVSVFVAAENRYFYENSVLAFDEILELAENNAEADVVISQGTIDGNAPLEILFTPNGDSELWGSPGDEVVVALPRKRIDDHPALRYLDIESIQFTGAREIQPPENATILVESESGLPLIYRVSHPERTVVVVNMDPLEGGFYFSAWFPTFLYTTSTHLAGREESLHASYQPGDAILLPGLREGERSQVTSPDAGAVVEVGPEDGSRIDSLGFYEVSNPGGAWAIGSSLLSRFDSGAAPPEVKSTVANLAMGRGISYWLIAIAIIVLAGESILYHRRKVG